MNALIKLASSIQEICEQRQWPFCIIGGVAVQHWGEPRFTKDVDLTVLTGFGGEEVIVDGLLEHFEPRVSDARDFSLKNRVLLLRDSAGIGIDVALGALPFEEEAVKRAKSIEVYPGMHLRLCTAEDPIVMKAFADRPLDWNDVKGVIIRQGNENLDWSYIFQHLTPLAELKEQPEIVARLRKMAGQ
jgi:predicted nucleotidyltransferase